MSDLSNHDDIIDSRDVIARIDELEDEIDTLKNTIEENEEKLAGQEVKDQELLDTQTNLQEELSELEEELKPLKSLAEQAEGYSDWRRGVTLIRDSYFEEYAQELAEDINGPALRDAEWPFNCIDWERAARELQMDYTSVSFDGVDYWVR